MSATPDEIDSPLEPACAAARELVRGYVADALDRGQVAKLRLHLSSCSACRAHLVASMNAVGTLAHVYTERHVRESSDEDESAGLGALEPAGRSYLRPWEKPRKRGRWNIAIVLGLIGLAGLGIAALPGKAAREIDVEWRSGLGSIGQRRMQSAWIGKCVRGERWVLEEGAALDARVGRTKLHAAGPARILVEEAEPLRLRIEAGAVGVEGPALVTSALGAVEVEAGASVVSYGPRGFGLDCRSGRASMVGSVGSVVLEPKQSALLGADGSWSRL